MINIGCDYHPSFQQIAWVDTESGEHGEQRLQHNEEAEKFYRGLKRRGVSVRVLGLTLVTHNTEEFRWVNRLAIEDWTSG